MKEMYLDNLPRGGKGINKNNINWGISIGKWISGRFNNIYFKFQIIDYNRNKKYYLTIRYEDKEYDIWIGDLKYCRVASILGVKSKSHKHKVGDIIEVKSGRIQIIELIMIQSGKEKIRGYRYKCLICGYENKITEGHLKEKLGCSVCMKQKVKIGVNDMWTTNPSMAKLLEDKDNGYLYPQKSNKKVNWICPDCGQIIHNKQISNICATGLACPRCGDGISYPEKLMFNILSQLSLKFKTQLSKTTFKWCDKYKYDFYFEYEGEKYIIETHGGQHYEENTNFRMTLEKVQENDKLKKQITLNNGIKEENYIVIDCRKSEIEWIKDNKDGILNSKLNEIFDLSKIDWDDCRKYTMSNLIKQACEIKNNNPDMTTTEIGKLMNMNRCTIQKYLFKGSSWGWCYYNPKEEALKSLVQNTNKRSKPVEIFKDDISLGVYNSGRELERCSKNVLGVYLNNSCVSLVCNGKKKSHKGFTFKYIEENIDIKNKKAS